jgi:hypothetical protein
MNAGAIATRKLGDFASSARYWAEFSSNLKSFVPDFTSSMSFDS